MGRNGGEKMPSGLGLGRRRVGVGRGAVKVEIQSSYLENCESYLPRHFS